MTIAGNPRSAPDRRLSVAPMMDWTDRHARYFLRLISGRALLYTEMIPTGAILRGDRPRFLRFDPAEHPVALQLGGSVPKELAACTAIGAEWGYDEINLNVGCPSDRVQSARFGACLMAEPQLVADCVAAMREAAAEVPVTVKHRIGVDERDSYDDLVRFVEAVVGAGCGTFIVHARKAWLQGLSPKENREVPPLRYEVVHRLKHDFPQLEVVVNGGITTAAAAAEQLRHVDGVMVGREAYQNPYALAAFERAIFPDVGPASERREVIEALIAYAGREIAEGVPLKAITRHALGLFNGLPGARRWRRHLSEAAHRPGADTAVIREAAALLARAGPEVTERAA